MHTFSKRVAFIEAWRRFKERPLFIIGVFLISAVVLSISGFVAERMPSGGVAAVVNVLDFALHIVVGMGVTRILLRVYDGTDTNYPDFFEPLSLFWNYLAMSILTAAIVLAGLVLFIVPGIIAALAVAFAAYLVIDTGMGPVAALKESIRITHGHRWNLFIFAVLLGVLNLAGALFAGVGLILTVPLTALATIHVYRWLRDPREEGSIRVPLLSKIAASLVVGIAFVAGIGFVFSLSLPTQDTTQQLFEEAQTRDQERRSDITDITLAATFYYLEHDRYPETLAALVPVYLPEVPTDPSTGQAYEYSAYVPEIDFEVCTYFEVDPAGILCQYGADENLPHSSRQFE